MMAAPSLQPILLSLGNPLRDRGFSLLAGQDRRTPKPYSACPQNLEEPADSMTLSFEFSLLAISVAALLLSVHATYSARMARLAAMRTEVRWELDNALVDASWLIDKANRLTEDTVKVAYELRAAEGNDFRPDEREAFALRDDAGRPLAELQQISPEMAGKSRKRLEAIRKEVARVRRSIEDIDTRIDVKSAVLDRLLGRSQTMGEASDRKVVFTSANLEARPGKNRP
jgi:hypothetical protein